LRKPSAAENHFPCAPLRPSYPRLKNSESVRPESFGTRQHSIMIMSSES
jgi:hypothetical protein